MMLYEIILLLLLIPVGLYLINQSYRNVYGTATIRSDLSKICKSFRRWRRKKKKS